MPTVRKEKASPDYERPEQNVADLEAPVALSTNKARGGVRVRGMPLVLTIGTAGAIVALALVWFYFGWG